jgi:hypothetical protein
MKLKLQTISERAERVREMTPTYMPISLWAQRSWEISLMMISLRLIEMSRIISSVPRLLEGIIKKKIWQKMRKMKNNNKKNLMSMMRSKLRKRQNQINKEIHKMKKKLNPE